MRFKDCPARLKADDAATADDGTFEAIVSVFGNVDHADDVVVPGAFADTLAEWKSSGDPIPVWWSHRMDDPSMNIGAVIEAAELPPGDERIPDWADQWVKDHGGLWVKGQLDTGPDASDKALATRRLMRSRRVTQFSYAYDVVEQNRNAEGHNELRKLRLYEVSPTPVGCNDLTELVTAKAAGMAAKAGRVLSGKNESNIRKAVELLSETLAALDGEAAAEGEPVKREEPLTCKGAGVKREELARPDASAFRPLIDLALLELEIAR